MLFKTNSLIKSKHVMFEPGNATRYEFIMTKIQGRTMVFTDILNDKAILVHPDHMTADGLELKLLDEGYGRGDAQPIADYLARAFVESEYIIYKVYEDNYPVNKIIWYKDTPMDRQNAQDEVEELGGWLLKMGTLL